MSSVAGSQAIVNRPIITSGTETIMWSLGDGPASEITLLADGASTSLRCTVAEHRWPAGSEGGLHTHLLEDEGFFVLEGTVTFAMPDDDVAFIASAGEFVWHPNRRRHGYHVSDEGPARVLQFLLPGTRLMPEFFCELQRGEIASDPARLVDWARDEFGVVFDAPETGLSPRPASTRGPGSADAGPPAADNVTVSNKPFKSDRSLALRMEVGRGMMTDVKCTFHAFGRQTGGVFGLTEISWGPGDVAGPHVHTLEDEGFYVLDGELTLHVAAPDGVVHAVARSGDFVWAPRDMPHYYEVTGEAGAKVLVFAVPGNTLTDFFYSASKERRGVGIEDDAQLEAFIAWSIERFGIHFFNPDEFPKD